MAHHPNPALSFNVMALPINVMAFPINGMAPGLAAAPGHGQVALGTKKVAALGGPEWGARATFFAPSATWPPGAAARPWERPVTGNAQ